MSFFTKTFCLTSFILLMAVFPTLAKTESRKDNPVTHWVAAENALLDAMPRGNKEVFFILRNKHSVIRSINIVHRDVKKAVVACGNENKDLKKPMTTRLKDWEKSVFPILKQAEKFLAQELKDQDAFHTSDYNHVMTLNDKAYEFSDAQIQKNPVTTPKACDALIASMDRTEDALVELLQEILLPQEVVRNRMQRAKKLKEKAEAATAKK